MPKTNKAKYIFPKNYKWIVQQLFKNHSEHVDTIIRILTNHLVSIFKNITKDATISWKYTHQPSSLQALFIRQIKHFNEPTLLKQRLIQLRKLIEEGDDDDDILHKFLVAFHPYHLKAFEEDEIEKTKEPKLSYYKGNDKQLSDAKQLQSYSK